MISPCFKRVFFLVILGGALFRSLAAEPQTIPLWPGKPPGETKELPPEADLTKTTENLIAGRRLIRLGNVSTPTMTIYRPTATNDTGTSVVICPGGGYQILAYDLEGTEVAEWLNRLGVTGILVKYRVPARDSNKRWLAGVQDAQRAVSLVRSRSAEWKLKPDQIGILGFSAGGHASAVTSLSGAARHYERVDDVDRVSSVPNFAILIYPWLAQKDTNGVMRLLPEMSVTTGAPPMFFSHAADDQGVPPDNSILMFQALRKVGTSAELHLHTSGGHGYGLRAIAGQTFSDWPRQCEAWMRQNGWLVAK